MGHSQLIIVNRKRRKADSTNMEEVRVSQS